MGEAGLRHPQEFRAGNQLASSEARVAGMGEPVLHTLCTHGRKMGCGSDAGTHKPLQSGIPQMN